MEADKGLCPELTHELALTDAVARSNGAKRSAQRGTRNAEQRSRALPKASDEGEAAEQWSVEQ